MLSYLAIALFVLVVLEVPLGISYARSQHERLSVDVERDAVTIASLVEDQLQFGAAEVDPDLGDYPDRTGGRVVITDANGISVHDAGDPGGERRDFSTRPEIARALTGERASGTRFSDTLQTELLYVAVPVASGGVVHGVVRITYPTAEVTGRIRTNWWILAAVATVVLLATAGVGWTIARWVTRPTRQVAQAVALAAEGDLRARAPTDAGPPEVRDLAHRFNQMAHQLDELLGAQRAFVADASHQLRSPLAALRLEIEDLPVRPEGTEGHLRVLDELRRLNRLVDGLLMLARAEAPARDAEPVDIAALVRERAETWRPLADESDVRLELAGPAHAVALAVPDHVDQILDNLLANSMEVAPIGSTIELEVVAEDPVHVVVRDAGPGMSPADRARAFDRFWRGERSQPGSGTGLGLPIARQLARACGGDLTLLPAPGRGTEALLTLPAAPRGARTRRPSVPSGG